MCQLARPRRYMNISGPFDEFPQDAERLIYVLEGMFGQPLLPFRLGALELARGRRRSFAVARIGLQQPVEDRANVAPVGLVCGPELGKRREAHETSQTFLGGPGGRDGGRLQVDRKSTR